MAYIKLPEFDEFSPAIQKALKPRLEKTGTIGESLRILALREDIFFATDRMAKSYLMDETELSFKTKERIALLVSLENGCKLCVGIHKQVARMLGMSEDEVEQAAKGLEYIEAEENEKKLLSFCLEASKKDNYKTTPEDIDALKRSGFTDSQILEAVAIVAYFNYINTISNVFGLES
jgi:uncharacterized peroxidase-related enzyme